ncbi:MAG: hypothetical protein NZ551_04490 [Microscillaceae bacterium]|nr:hypothetical protein [Microscillaceae bacterium]MDW8460450.1 hypothetical protein [Cytophagales bacterium]
MSDIHGDTRKALTFHTTAFGISSLMFLGFTTIKWIAGTSGLTTLALLVGYGALSVPAFIRAWRAFGEANYEKCRKNGFISWLYPAGVTLARIFLG